MKLVLRRVAEAISSADGFTRPPGLFVGGLGIGGGCGGQGGGFGQPPGSK